jgi:hypothetical protein
MKFPEDEISETFFKENVENEEEELVMKVINNNNFNSELQNYEKICALCNVESKMVCSQCGSRYYCCYEHFRYDYFNFHFFECQLIQFFKRIDIMSIRNFEIRYKILYNELISRSKINIFNGQILYRNQSDINLFKNKKENENDIKNIYEELYIIINFLKENKNSLNEMKQETSLFSNYFDILEKNQFLKDKDINYIKFIKNFGINDRDNIHISNHANKGLLITRKRNNSCLNLKNISFPKRKFDEFHITYYHQGTYYLFN